MIKMMISGGDLVSLVQIHADLKEAIYLNRSQT